MIRKTSLHVSLLPGDKRSRMEGRGKQEEEDENCTRGRDHLREIIRVCFILALTQP